MAKKKKTSITDSDNWVEKAKRRQALLTNLTAEQVMKAVDYIDGDGHTVYKKEVLIDTCGWPGETASAVCHEIHSDMSDPKSTLFGNDGRPLDKLYGWYCLDLLSSLASALNVKYEHCMGRGFQARKITEALREHFKEPASV